MANALTPVIVLPCMDCNKEKEYVRKKIVFVGNVFKDSKYLTNLFRKYLLQEIICLFLKLNTLVTKQIILSDLAEIHSVNSLYCL